MGERCIITILLYYLLTLDLGWLIIIASKNGISEWTYQQNIERSDKKPFHNGRKYEFVVIVVEKYSNQKHREKQRKQ